MRFAFCDVAALKSLPGNTASCLEALIDDGFSVYFLVDQPGDTQEVKAWLVKQGYAPCGFGDRGATWVVARQPSLIQLPVERWFASIIEYHAANEPEIIVFIGHDCPAIVPPTCRLIIASSLARGVEMARAAQRI